MTIPDKTTITEPPSLVKDPARRAAELAARNTPPRVACTSIKTRALGPTAQDQVFLVDPLCLVDGLINGFPPLDGLPP